MILNFLTLIVSVSTTKYLKVSKSFLNYKIRYLSRELLKSFSGIIIDIYFMDILIEYREYFSTSIKTII